MTAEKKSAALIMNGQSHVTAKYWMSTATTTTTTREEIKSKFIKKNTKKRERTRLHLKC